MIYGTLVLGAGAKHFTINTKDANGDPITWASAAIRVAVNDGDWLDDGYTLDVDHDYNGASDVTGAHELTINPDDASLGLVHGDELRVFQSGGTVAGHNVAGNCIARFDIVDGSLATQTIDDIKAALLAAGYEDGETVQEYLRLTRAVLVGESTDGGKTFLSKDGATERVAATVNGSKERTAVVTDAS